MGFTCREVDDGKVSSSGVVTNPKTSSNNWLSEQATQQQLKQIAEYVEMLSSACDNICCIDTSGKMLRSIFKSEVSVCVCLTLLIYFSKK